jgi:hypothetical protein
MRPVASDLTLTRLALIFVGVVAVAAFVYLVAPQMWWFSFRSGVPLLVWFLAILVASSVLLSGYLVGWHKGQRLLLIAMAVPVVLGFLVVVWLLTPSDTLP